MRSFSSAADEFVGPAPSAVCEAYQKLAARIFNVSAQARLHCRFHAETLCNRHRLRRQMAAVKAQ